MLKSHAILSLALAGALLTGCKKEPQETPAPEPTNPVPAAPTPPVLPVHSTTPEVSTTPPATSPAAGPLTTVTPDGAPSDADADAKKFIDAADSDIRARKWEAAEASVRKLEAMTHLSEPVKTAVQATRQNLITARAASHLHLPAATTRPSSDDQNK